MSLEALEVKNDTLEKEVNKFESENSSLKSILEMANAQLLEQTEALSKEINNRTDFVAEKASLANELIEANKQLTKLEKVKKETVDDFLILESTLESKDSQIEKLKHEISSLKSKKIPDYKCDECEYTSDTEDNLKQHTKIAHEVVCSFCNCSFAGNKKLSTHVCKIVVENPTSSPLYMKDWFVRNGCIRNFDGDIKREVFNLHSEDCVSSSSCTSLPENFKTEKYFKDTQEIIHLTTSDCMESNRVKWLDILMKRFVNGPQIILP